MGLIDNAREMVSLAAEVGKIDLHQKAVDLMAQLVQLSDENQSLRQQVAALTEKLAIGGTLDFNNDAYWRPAVDAVAGIEYQDGPFCSRCWDMTAKLVRLHTVPGLMPGSVLGHKCPECANACERTRNTAVREITKRRDARKAAAEKSRAITKEQ